LLPSPYAFFPPLRISLQQLIFSLKNWKDYYYKNLQFFGGNVIFLEGAEKVMDLPLS
jgi:hypothetical protein